MNKKKFLLVCDDEKLITVICFYIASYCSVEKIPYKIDVRRNKDEISTGGYDAILIDDREHIRMSTPKPNDDQQDLLKPFNRSMFGHALQALFASDRSQAVLQS